MKSPNIAFSCRHCTERTVGCHGSCETYINERKEFDRIKAEMNKDYDVGIYTSDRVGKTLAYLAKRR